MDAQRIAECKDMKEEYEAVSDKRDQLIRDLWEEGIDYKEIMSALRVSHYHLRTNIPEMFEVEEYETEELKVKEWEVKNVPHKRYIPLKYKEIEESIVPDFF